MKTINWTKPMLKRFKKAYCKARSEKLEEFTFDGNDFVTDYARFLSEYLDTIIKDKND